MNQNEAKMNVDQYDYESIFYSKDMMCKCGKTESEMKSPCLCKKYMDIISKGT